MKKPTKTKYNVFISYTQADKLIAKEIQLFIKEEFKGEIVPFLAGDDIKSGDKWKETIKHNIEVGDSIISVITNNSKAKPWLFVEWSAFWLSDKDIHILLSEGLSHSDLIHPMQDLQYVTLTNEDAMKGFLQRLSAAANYRPAPYDKAEELIIRIRAASHQQVLEENANSYEKYTDKKINLPADDTDKQKIAEYFILKKNINSFNRIFNAIKKDDMRFKLVTVLIRNQQYELAIKSALQLRSPELLRDIIIDLLDEDLDDKKIYPLIREVAKNQPQLRIIMIELIDQGKQGGDLFANVLSQAVHTPTLHRVATYLMEGGQLESDTFKSVVYKIYTNNAAEARKLGIEMINNGIEETKQFDEIIKGTANRNQMEASAILRHLRKFNSNLFDSFIKAGVITSSAALKRLEEDED